ncbi:MAG: sigma-70 family RNA polymerase sigma factor, partial [Opitutae bacterium]|nr:sigma-70 family RNA polymerase sigma factor [Opitutae bacterium]
MTDAEADKTDVHRVLAGETDAFSGLLARHRDHVLSIVRRHVPPDQVQETAQDVFVRAFQSLGTFRQMDRFRSWLAAIAVRTCYDYWRRRYRRREVAVSQLSEAHRAWLERVGAADAEQAWQALGNRAEARQVLDWALAQLSAEDRMVIELVHLEEQSVQEAARLLGWSAVAQSGFALMAVAVFGRSADAASTLLVFLAAYAVANLNDLRLHSKGALSDTDYLDFNSVTVSSVTAIPEPGVAMLM